MRKKILVVLFLCFFLFLPGIISSQDVEIPIAFKINLLSLNTDPARNQWSLLIQEQLPKIGIGVTFHESTSLKNIASRTWFYPGGECGIIPPYSEGGFDILLIGWSWDLDWDPTDFYSTSSIYPSGNNFYQYNNPNFDEMLNKYLKTINSTLRTQYSHELQAMLYDDLPAISITYPRELYGFKEHLYGIDELLFATSNLRPENWGDSEDHIIVYAIPEKLKEYNIFLQESFYDAQWMSAIYGSLFKRGQDHHDWEPAIANTTTFSSDGRNITVTIDSNAKFSDGNPVLAEDIKYSYELYMSPKLCSSPFSSKSKYQILTRWFASNDSIEVIDTHSLNFNLTDDYSFALGLLSFGIIDKSTVEPAISTYGYDIFGEVPLTGNVQNTLVKSCGPFKLDFYYPNSSSVRLKPNLYWNNLTVSKGKQPLLDELNISYISSVDSALAGLFYGNIDILDSHYDLVQLDVGFGDGPIVGKIVKVPKHEEIAINMKHPIIGTGELTPVGTTESAKNIRKAISHAIPRNYIVDEIQRFGDPGISPIPDSCIGFDKSLKPYAYDLDLAIDYMEKTGVYSWHTWPPYETGITSLILLSLTSLVSVSCLRRIRLR